MKIGLKSSTVALCLLLCILCQAAQAQQSNQAVSLTDAETEYPLGLHLEYLADPDDALTIDNVTSPQYDRAFVANQTAVLNLGYVDSPYWVRFGVHNTSQQSEWLLEMSQPTVHHMVLYSPTADGGYTQQESGLVIPFTQRAIPHHSHLFRVAVPPQAERTFYLKVHQNPLTLPLSLWSNSAFARADHHNRFFLGIFYGAFFVMTLYNLLLFLGMRERTNLYYTLLTLNLGFLFLTYDGVIYQYLWPAAAWPRERLPFLLTGTLLICLLKFVQAYLETAPQAPRWHRALTAMVIVTVAFLLMGLTGQFPWLLFLFPILVLGMFGVILGAGLQVRCQRNHLARPLLGLASGVGLCAALFLFMQMGLLPYLPLIELAFRLALVLQALFSSIILTDQIKLLRKQRAAAQSQALAAAQEKERLLQEQPIVLEQKVWARMATLENQKEAMRRRVAELEAIEQEYRQAKATSEQSKGLYSDLFEHSGESIFVVDPTTLRLLDVNANAARRLGYEREEMLHLTLEDVEVVAADSQQIWESTVSGTTFYESRFRHQDGSEIPVEVSSRTVHLDQRDVLLLFVRDITARKLAVAALRESEERFAAVVNSMEEIVYVADIETYKILFVNRYTREIFGDVVGQLCWQALQSDQNGPCAFCTNPYLLQEGAPTGVYAWDFQNTRTGRWYHLQDQVIRWTDGRLVRLEIATDITEIKKAEAQKQRLSAVEERERIGRELHDDLGQVMGYINVQAQAIQELLAQGKMDQVGVTLGQLIEAAKEAHTDIRRYILGIRTNSHFPDAGNSLEIASTDFVGILGQYLHKLSEIYDLKVAVSLPEEEEGILLSPEVGTQLLRIIQEALTNVRKHAEVDTARLYLFPDAEQIRVVIEDKGRGFVPGAVADLREEGSTLGGHGLTIMRERAESVGGTFMVNAQPGAGTRITVRVPKLVSATGETTPGQGLRVLLVDDHPLFLEGIRTLLSVRGLQVVGVARDGLEAQEQARALLPDLILMDVQMPHCDGVEATQHIKAELPEVRVVMLTVAADDDTLFAALKAGASGYLLKSLSGDEFFRLLGNIVRGEVVLAPELAARMLAEFRRTKSDAPPGPPDGAFAELTAQQVEILDYVAQGLTYKEAAAKVHLSERTIRYHMGQILERLQLQSRREAITYARRKGLGQPD